MISNLFFKCPFSPLTIEHNIFKLLAVKQNFQIYAYVCMHQYASQGWNRNGAQLILHWTNSCDLRKNNQKVHLKWGSPLN